MAGEHSRTSNPSNTSIHSCSENTQIPCGARCKKSWVHLPEMPSRTVATVRRWSRSKTCLCCRVVREIGLLWRWPGSCCVVIYRWLLNVRKRNSEELSEDARFTDAKIFSISTSIFVASWTHLIVFFLPAHGLFSMGHCHTKNIDIFVVPQLPHPWSAK